VVKKHQENMGIVIARIPVNTKKAFLDFAKQDFCGDYGMTLKHLLDFYVGLIPSGVEHLELEINRLKERIDSLEKKKDEKVPTKRLDGTGGKIENG